jgi:alpha-glucoside transport system permease protein
MTIRVDPTPGLGSETTPSRRSSRAKPTAARPRNGAGSATWPIRIVLALVCVVWMTPVVGLLINSFRTRDIQFSSGWWSFLGNPLDATQWTLDNYDRVLGNSDTNGVNMCQAFVNSLMVTIPATVIPILIAAFASYAFTFMRWRGRNVIFVIIVGLLVVPSQVALVPMLKLYGQLGINHTFLAVWLAHLGFGMPLAVYIFRNYMSSLPGEVIESAKVDGASHFTTFWRLIVPMSVPAIASFAIFQFLWVWNDLLIALLFLGRGDNTVLTVALQGLQGQTGQGRELIPAAGFVTIIVPVMVFLSLQRYFIRGMTTGAVKG